MNFRFLRGVNGVTSRNDLRCWSRVPAWNAPEVNKALKEAGKVGEAIWEGTGKGVSVDMVFEHPGEATFPVSTLVVKKGGIVVICAGTSGVNCTFDVRYMWMHQKRLQGSHFANIKQAESANRLRMERPPDHGLSERCAWDEIRGGPLN